MDSYSLRRRGTGLKSLLPGEKAPETVLKKRHIGKFTAPTRKTGWHTPSDRPKPAPKSFGSLHSCLFVRKRKLGRVTCAAPHPILDAVQVEFKVLPLIAPRATLQEPRQAPLIAHHHPGKPG